LSWIQRRSLATRVLHTLLLSVLVGLFTFFCPTPWALEAPGPFYKTRSLVHIKGARLYESKGHFVLLTVISEPASLLYCLYSFFDPAARLVSRSQPQAQSGGRGDAWQMHLSQSLSANVALAYLLDQKPDFVHGLWVRQIFAESPNSKALKVDDHLEVLDGQSLHHVLEVGAVLKKHKVGDQLAAQILRQGKNRQVKLEVWKSGERKMIGAQFTPVLGTPEDPFVIRIDSEHVGGASGGLVFCLEIIDQLSPGDLTGGRVVAATGTLDLQGRVGPIEGIRYKLVGAQRAGAQLFLCPAQNLEELKGIQTTLKVVGVSNLDEALAALRS
jgi:PDZ domain-containing protein